MPVYLVTLERVLHVVEQCVVEIEAPNEARATAGSGAPEDANWFLRSKTLHRQFVADAELR